MPVVGMAIKTMEAKKEKDIVNAQISVNSTPTVKDVKEIDVPTLGKKTLSIAFEFVTKYDPSVGEIKLTGDILYLAKDNKVVLSEWKKNKKIPESDSLEILNHLFRRCLIKITSLADDLQMPPPIQFPVVKPKQKNQDPAVG